MSLSVVCYPQPGKAKSRLILEAFAQGCGGRLAKPGETLSGVPAFFGVVGIEHLWDQAQEFLYGDNAYFDVSRGTHFRFARNRLQETGKPDWKRWKRLGLKVKPWRKGRHVVVVAQSPHFMVHVARWPGGAIGWQEHVLTRLGNSTDRPIVFRHWSRDKMERARSLKADLEDAWAVVGHSTAALNEALLAGVTVFATGECVALPMGSSVLEAIESPRRPEGREAWAAGLAGRQWTLEELADGTAWRALDGMA